MYAKQIAFKWEQSLFQPAAPVLCLIERESLQKPHQLYCYKNKNRNDFMADKCTEYKMWGHLVTFDPSSH